ncbi:MAG TPA: glycoside hydrolase family 127 protein [Steroidobacteraceae bacterium]|jgi:hypothetical protein
MSIGNRRKFMQYTAAAAVFAQTWPPAPARASAAAQLPNGATALPLTAIRLLPSDYASAVDCNRRYLLSLSPDRLLHNFRRYAGLEPKAPVYGGWESDTLAGHTLGHYMSALVLMHAQTGDAEFRQRANYVVDELAVVQRQRGNGYVGALGRRRTDNSIVDGEEIFAEIAKGQIHASGFDLNGAWSPLYTVHKVMAGLLDIHAAWDNGRALSVAAGLAGYFERIFAALDDAQMQQLLVCEYGGLNESYAELYARTSERRWLLIAERLYDRKVLDPLAAQSDQLASLHANTQVPKLIGLARLHELTGEASQATAARFFWEAVTRHHSYVIGGNADREYFSAPDTIATYITDQTCEHCNTYNMLKLTEHLFAWSPDGAWFDFYERAHLNHVMAAHDLETGGFTYMTPLMSGAAREYSDPADDPFWCCVGTGMESHAKHGAAIFWEGAGTLFVNLYIPATAHWRTRGANLRLETGYPFDSMVRLTLEQLAEPATFTIALRVPGWARQQAVSLGVNGAPVALVTHKGYALLERRWQRGDVVTITLPLELRIEAAPGDSRTVSVLRGPLVLAGDLGPAGTKWQAAAPVFVGEQVLKNFVPTGKERSVFRTRGLVKPADLTFVPFYRQHARLSAVYFQRSSQAQWDATQAELAAEQRRLADLEARSIDVARLGEAEPESAHLLVAVRSYSVSYRGRSGRDARSGGFFEFDMACAPGPLILRMTYYGDERARDFDVFVAQVRVATQHLDADRPGQFFEIEYAIPQDLTRGAQRVRVRFVPHDGSAAGPVFGVRMMRARALGTT